MKTSASGNIAAALTSAATLVLLLTAIPATANPAADTLSPKQRIEREFRRLETSMSRYVYDRVLTAADLDRMNTALFDFMRENPGVTRMLRVNAGGLTVNDVSTDSPRSAPTRNIGAQRWFQHIAQAKRPYYSMDADSAGGSVSLFYAWPLFSGPSRDVFSGAFAALIDFTAHTAMVEDAPPFQIAYLGRPFYQHEWEEYDYNEEPLEIRGAADITIRTIKPLQTRLDPIARTAPAAQAAKSGDGEKRNDEDEEEGDTPASSHTRSKKPWIASISLLNTAILGLLILIALMIGYIIFRDRSDRQTPTGRFVIDEPDAPETSDEPVVIVRPLGAKPARAESKPPEAELPEQPEMPAQQEPAAPAPTAKKVKQAPQLYPEVLVDIADDPYDRYVDTIIMDTVVDRDRRDSDQQQQALIAKMLKLIREEFVIMEQKMQILSMRIDELEKNKR